VELPVARNGNVEYFDGSYVPKHGPDGKLDGLIGYFRNVTERKRAEEALRESEERFRAAFEEGAVAMALAALDSTLLKVNTSFCRMLGFSASELVGRPFTEITHPDDLPVNLIGIQRLACGEVSSFRMEKRYIRKDGTVLWADMSTASVRDAQGRPLYLVTHVHDVTDRKQAEEALRRLNERLELQVAQRTEDLRHTVGRLQQLTLEISQAEDRERRRIADLLHDDVQQTLAAAKFHLNLLSSEARSPEESQEIVEQVKQMLKEAIEKSRSLSHELSPVLYQVDLTEVLNWLARHMQHRHGLIVHVEACGPVDSSSEPMKAFLYRVAQELLFNVVKHADVGEARIRVRRMGRCICLLVVDRGRGFDSQRVEEAAGFGLRTIQERVQLLGGRMKIKSTRGTGTRLLIAVPDEGPPQVAAPTELGDGWVQTENLQRDQPDGASRKHGHSASLGP
jgi:PAS domain S-box-containing protein